MKIKTILALLTILLITFIIYIINIDRKIYILSLGNSNIYEIPSYIDKLSSSLEEKNLLEENINVKKYSKEKIVIIGQLTQDNIKISKKYEIELISIDLKQNQNEMIYANLINTIKEVYNL